MLIIIDLFPNCVLAKLFERLVCDQLKDFLEENNILTSAQSGFRKKHSAVTATLKVFNDFIIKKICVALFLDLSKAFDTVDHRLFLITLNRIG